MSAYQQGARGQVDVMRLVACAYGAHGWPVFPLRGKLPALAKARGGSGFLDATTDPVTINEMWTRFPGANIGVRTGAASGIAVLDVDPRHGGLETLIAIEVQHGVLPGTVTQMTGGLDGGLHLLYRHQAGLGTTAGWGPGLDVRGEGGYFVAAPSVHPDTGRGYRWLGDQCAQPLPPWPVTQLPVPAKTMMKKAATDCPSNAVTTIVTDSLSNTTTASTFLQPSPGPLPGLVRTVVEAAEGTRNGRLNWASFRAGEHVRLGRLDASEVAGALYAAGVAAGLAHAEVVRTVASGLGSSRGAA